MYQSAHSAQTVPAAPNAAKTATSSVIDSIDLILVMINVICPFRDCQSFRFAIVNNRLFLVDN